MLDPVELGVLVRIGRFFPGAGPLERDVAGVQDLWVPRTSSTSRDQAVFADHATDASLPPDPVLIKIDLFG